MCLWRKPKSPVTKYIYQIALNFFFFLRKISPELMSATNPPLLYMWDACHIVAWQAVWRSTPGLWTSEAPAAEVERAKLTAGPLGWPLILFLTLDQCKYSLNWCENDSVRFFTVNYNRWTTYTPRDQLHGLNNNVAIIIRRRNRTHKCFCCFGKPEFKLVYLDFFLIFTISQRRNVW